MRLLVIDTQYLVALEAEHVLGEAFSCPVEIGMPRDVEGFLEAGEFSVAVVDAALITAALGGRIQRLLDAGAGFVFSSVDSQHHDGVTGFPEVPVVLKPFNDEKLVEAVGFVLAQGPRN
ncbi:hypothetical protein ACFSE1_15195 [Rhizobium helianthi]|uniref:Response regulatory domain-containing protein n=1 Tax=Rhizobium helianthi TaxID=1132695 RepID=A0ABW4M8P3_9HYPH